MPESNSNTIKNYTGISIFRAIKSCRLVKNEKIETSVFTIFVGDDHICRAIVKNKADVKIDEAQIASETVRILLKGEKGPILVDMRKIKSITKEAREHFTMKHREGYVNAIGLLVKSPLSMLIANFFLGINKTDVPTKLFTNEKKALEWLGKFL